jgi:hypothetical protein
VMMISAPPANASTIGCTEVSVGRYEPGPQRCHRLACSSSSCHPGQDPAHRHPSRRRSWSCKPKDRATSRTRSAAASGLAALYL